MADSTGNGTDIVTRMLDRFRDHLRSTGLIPEGSSVLVGYSGGADSTCLLHILKEVGIDVAAGHLHHGQRPEADLELKLCEAFCSDLGVPFVSGRANVPLMARQLKIGLEEAGRRARYSFFQNAAYRLQCPLVATAHTGSDLSETVLLNLTRGAGLHGLAGIPPKRENIIRPLLTFLREETRAYCEEQGLWFHDDPANQDLSFSRARIRHRVVSELRLINPSFDSAVERMVGIVSEEDRFLNGMATAALEQCETPLNGDLRFLTLNCEIALDRKKMSGLPPVLFKRGLRLTVEALGGALSFGQTEALLNGMTSESRGSVTADEGKIVIEWSPNSIQVRDLGKPVAFRHPLTIPGETISDEFFWSLSARLVDGAPGRISRSGLQAQLDRTKIKGSLYFKSLQQGDEMQPYGFSGHRKLSALLSDAKLTKAARERLPIICDMIGPIWAPGVCLGARCAANSDSERYMLLRFGPVNDVEGHNVGNAT